MYGLAETNRLANLKKDASGNALAFLGRSFAGANSGAAEDRIGVIVRNFSLVPNSIGSAGAIPDRFTPVAMVETYNVETYDTDATHLGGSHNVRSGRFLPMSCVA